jgi:hypothetical protein
VTPGPHTLQCSLERVSVPSPESSPLVLKSKPAQVNYGRTSPGRTGLYTHLNNWTRCLPRRRMHVPTHRPANQDHYDTIAAPSARFPKSHPSDLRLARARVQSRRVSPPGDAETYHPLLQRRLRSSQVHRRHVSSDQKVPRRLHRAMYNSIRYSALNRILHIRVLMDISDRVSSYHEDHSRSPCAASFGISGRRTDSREVRPPSPSLNLTLKNVHVTPSRDSGSDRSPCSSAQLTPK